MSVTASVYGRLGGTPEGVATKTGKPMTRASLAVDQGEGKPTLWLRLISFGEKAEHLAAHAKGDSVAAVGRLQLSEWTDREGAARKSLELVVETLASARRVPTRNTDGRVGRMDLGPDAVSAAGVPLDALPTVGAGR